MPKIDKAQFKKNFHKDIWRVLRETIEIVTRKQAPEKTAFLDSLYSDIMTLNYYPSLPVAYLISDKHNRVARHVPVFNYRESCVFFWCVKQLEEEIACNRVEGTFGGWRLGNPIRKKEEQDVEMLEEGGYVPFGAYNRGEWLKHWRDFQKKAYQYATQGEYNCFLKFDIANFYDSINLNLLEGRIRYCTNNEKSFVVDLLFHFLRNWNRQFEGYSLKNVGIPQDSVGDCSRILANFFLQDYDQRMKAICDHLEIRYLRYADDQIVMANSIQVTRQVLFEASKELFRNNLSVNSSKVVEYNSFSDFSYYWAFDLFQMLDEAEDRESLNRAVKTFLDRFDGNNNFRYDSVLKRLLTTFAADDSLIDRGLIDRVLEMACEQPFLESATDWHFGRIYNIISDKEGFLARLDDIAKEVYFNSYLYSLIRFYNFLIRQHKKIGDDTKVSFYEGKASALYDRIEVLSEDWDIQKEKITPSPSQNTG